MGRILLIHTVNQVATKETMLFLVKWLPKMERYELEYCLSATEFTTLVFRDCPIALRISKDKITKLDAGFVREIRKHV